MPFSFLKGIVSGKPKAKPAYDPSKPMGYSEFRRMAESKAAEHGITEHINIMPTPIVVRAVQASEGNEQCFNRKEECMNAECCWFQYCCAGGERG